MRDTGRSAVMVEVKFIDGTPVPDDYLTSASRLVRNAAPAIDMFGEDELEAAREQASGDKPNASTTPMRCCVCGEEIFDKDESEIRCLRGLPGQHSARSRKLH